MRVTFLHPTHALVPSGGGRVVHEYANYLVRRGHEVNLVFPFRVELGLGIAHHAARRIIDWWKARTSATVRRLMGKSALRWMALDPRINLCFVGGLDPRFIPDADAVFATYWGTAEYVAGYPASKGEKFYLIQHYETWAGPKARVDSTWLTPLHKVVVSRWLYEIGSSLRATQMRYITNAIDHQHFRIIPTKNPRPLALLSMYNSQPWKGGADVLAVFCKVHERFPDMRMSMFGLHGRAPEIPSWIEYFHDPTPREMRDLYNQHSIYVGASWEEGWGLPPAEAMACGCTFVGTDIGGFREFAINGRTALLSSPRDRDAMFENVCRLIENPGLHSRLQKTGTEYIRQLTWEKSGALLEQYLYDVVQADRCEAPAVELMSR
jgi:glycosyltransferase involved in cell wall biosynthesis